LGFSQLAWPGLATRSVRRNMTHRYTWIVLRPIVAATLAVLAWIVAMYLTCLLPGTSGKFLTDRGFVIGSVLFSILLLTATSLARLRWWDCVVPTAIPLWIVGFDLTDYWTWRVWLAFVTPIVISVAVAGFRYREKHFA
jgi:hypothetical protein